MDKYKLPVSVRIQTVQEQIAESQRIIYRNDLENLAFKANNDKHKQIEVKTNNAILKEKLDLLWKELERLDNEAKAGGDTPIQGSAV